ncbi:MAG TPA: hypothetical protein PKD86_04820 [Gemmatales bacterium]|nr:hypothetical protein [Gemmatales bacterium]HMP58655.1 hypothetical protein [Gemmatales bacterium]
MMHAAAVLFFLTIPLLAPGQDKEAWRENIDTAIEEGIRLLEAKEYVTFVKSFISPKELEQVKQEMSWEELASRFERDGNAATLLKVFKAIKGQKPEQTEDDGRKMRFAVPKELKAPRSDIVFVKIGKYWYLSN